MVADAVTTLARRFTDDDPVVAASSLSLALMCSVYIAWHGGGADREPLQFAVLISTALAVIILWRAAPTRMTFVVGAMLGIVTAWSAVSTAASVSPTRGLEVVLTLAWYALLVLAGGAAVRAGAMGPLLVGLLMGGVVQAAVGLFDRWGAGSATALASGTFYARNQFAGFLAMLLPLALASVFIGRRRLWAAIGAALIACGLLVTASRGGALAAIVGIVVVTAATAGGVLPRILRLGAVLLAAFALSWFLSSPLALPDSSDAAVGPGSATASLTSRPLSATESTTRERWRWWISAVRIWRDEPVLGTGPGTYGYALFSHQDSEWRWSLYAHNGYAQALAEIGAPGAALLTASVATGMGAALAGAARRRHPLAGGVAGALVAASAHIAIDNDLEYPALAACFFLLIGAATGLVHARPSGRRSALVLTGALVIPIAFLLVGEEAAGRAVRNPRSSATRAVADVFHPRDADPWSSLALDREDRGDLEGALVAAREWAARDGMDPGVWVSVGRLADRTNRPDEAIAGYEMATVRHPNNPSLHLALADALARHRSAIEAFAVIDRGLAIRLDPSDGKYPQLAELAEYGEALARAGGDADRAAMYAERRRALAPA